MSLEQLIEDIKRAFPIRPVPNRVWLVIDGSPESYEVSHNYDGVAWDQLTEEDLNTKLQGDLNALSPAGIRYYLPAFLVNSLTSIESADGAVLVFTLSGRISEKHRDRIRERASELSAEQIELLIRVIREVEKKRPYLANYEESIKLLESIAADLR